MACSVFLLDSVDLIVLILNCRCDSELWEELFQKVISRTLVQNKPEFWKSRPSVCIFKILPRLFWESLIYRLVDITVPMSFYRTGNGMDTHRKCPLTYFCKKKKTILLIACLFKTIRIGKNKSTGVRKKAGTWLKAS